MAEVGQVLNLEEMADRLAIIEIMHAYARVVDRADAEILKSAYWDDAELDYGGYKGSAHVFCTVFPAKKLFYRPPAILTRQERVQDRRAC
jgi:hypothetical protein